MPRKPRAAAAKAAPAVPPTPPAAPPTGFSAPPPAAAPAGFTVPPAAAAPAPAGFGSFGAVPPAPGQFGTAPPATGFPAATPMTNAVTAAHPPVTHPAQAAPVDLGPVLAAIAELSAKVDANAMAVTKLGSSLSKKLGELADLVQPAAPAPTPAPQAAPPAAAATPPTGPDQAQYDQVVKYIREMNAAQKASNPAAVPIMANDPTHLSIIATVAIQSGAPYLQGANANDPNLQQHLQQILAAAGAIGPSGELLS